MKGCKSTLGGWNKACIDIADKDTPTIVLQKGVQKSTLERLKNCCKRKFFLQPVLIRGIEHGVLPSPCMLAVFYSILMFAKTHWDKSLKSLKRVFYSCKIATIDKQRIPFPTLRVLSRKKKLTKLSKARITLPMRL
jgi:hypothetical protein